MSKKNSQTKHRGNTRSTKGLVTRASANGTALNLPDDPPTTTEVPFNSVVLRMYMPAEPSMFTGTTILTYLKGQLGISVPADHILEFKIQKVRIWGPLGGDVQLRVFNPISSEDTELATISDVGTASSRPSAGYLYPLSVRTRALAGTQFLFACSGSSAVSNTSSVGITLVDLLWRARPNTHPAKMLVATPHPGTLYGYEEPIHPQIRKGSPVDNSQQSIGIPHLPLAAYQPEA